jgi:DNA-binding response OmpR family regulator
VNPAPHPVDPESDREQHTVLVVDDEELNRHLYSALLASAGYRVEVALDGDDAIRRMSASRPDVVLLDFRMPGLDGPGVLSWMRKSAQHAETPVVLLTASGEAEHVSAAFDAGADDYLLKPVNSRILLARVRSTIRARESKKRIVDAERREKEDEAVRSRLLHDLEEARQVQLAQVPAFPIERDGNWYSGCVVSCGHVGGDSIDVVEMADQSTVAVLVDVAGHGTAAALVASSIRTELRFLLASHAPEEAIVLLGRRILRDIDARHVCVGMVAMKGDHFSVVNAGIPPIWIGSRDVARMLVAPSGPPPGLVDVDAYGVTRGQLAPGEVIALVSDGLTEPFGYADDVHESIPTLVGALPTSGAPASDLLGRAALRVFELHRVEERPDDATVLLVGRTG